MAQRIVVLNHFTNKNVIRTLLRDGLLRRGSRRVGSLAPPWFFGKLSHRGQMALAEASVFGELGELSHTSLDCNHAQIGQAIYRVAAGGDAAGE